MATSAPDIADLQDILLVDDDPGAIQTLRGILGSLARLRFATNGKDALRLAQECIPDLVLLDAEMPGMTGFQLLAALKSEAALSDIPVVFITGHAEPAFEVSALELGAADFIAKPFRAASVLARVRTHLRMKRMADELRRAATIDPLTGVANRRLFDSTLTHEWLRARRTADPLSLLLIDVDHFKQYNDRYGHLPGDDCLRRVAHALAQTCQRPADLVARYGGEEFMVLLPLTPRAGADHVARRLHDAIRSLGSEHADGVGGAVTVSVGIACHDGASPCATAAHENCRASDLVLAADSALYDAKHAGRAQSKRREIMDAGEASTRADDSGVRDGSSIRRDARP
jgi:diguanylate cyclase (GGDEF)-like protein